MERVPGGILKLNFELKDKDLKSLEYLLEQHKCKSVNEAIKRSINIASFLTKKLNDGYSIELEDTTNQLSIGNTEIFEDLEELWSFGKE